MLLYDNFESVGSEVIKREGQTDRKLNRILRHDTAQNYRIHTEWFGVCLNLTSEFHTIAVFESFVKHNYFPECF
jgi:hypothetical protein